MCKEEFAKDLDRSVFPGVQGGPLVHIIAAKAVAFGEALQPNFKTYQEQVIANAKVLAQTLADGGLRIVSGGTDNHLMVVDMSRLLTTKHQITSSPPKNATGKVIMTTSVQDIMIQESADGDKLNL